MSDWGDHIMSKPRQGLSKCVHDLRRGIPLGIGLGLAVVVVVAILYAATHRDLPYYDDPSGLSFLDAARCGNVRMVEKFLDSGADVNERDKYAKTALHCACDRGKTRLAALLIQRGADMTAQDTWGQTPLYTAVATGHADTAQLLLQSGADPNAVGTYGRTPLHDATDPAVAKVLIAAGAKVNARGINGDTPLHRAIRFSYFRDRLALPKLLIENGADVNALNSAEKTPLDCTVYPELRALLRKHGGKSGTEIKAGKQE